MQSHVLLALAPFPQKYHNVLSQNAWFIKVVNDYFGALFGSRALCFSVAMNPHQDSYWKANYPSTYSKIKRKIYLNPKDIAYRYNAGHIIFSEPVDSKLVEVLTARVTSQYGNLPPPDLILQFGHHAPYLLSAFKNSPLINFREGGFTRKPFQSTWRFESGKYLVGSGRYGDSYCRLKNNNAKSPNNTVDYIRSDSFAALERINPFKIKLNQWKEKYQRLVLLPLQASGFVSFDVLCEYESQYHYLIDVLEKLPNDVGIIVTEHPHYPVLTKKIYDHLSAEYPNLIYEDNFHLTENVSFFFTPHVHAVISVSSTVFWQAALMGKICCGLGTGEFSRLADTSSIYGLNQLLRNDDLSPFRYDSLIYERLTQNWVPEPLMMNPEFLEKWLKNLCSEKYPKPDISDSNLKSFSCDASKNLELSVRDPFLLLRNSDLPLSYGSLIMKPNFRMWSTLIIALCIPKKLKSYILMFYRKSRYMLRVLKRSIKAS